MNTPRTITRLGLRHPAVLAAVALALVLATAVAALAAGWIEKRRYDESLRSSLRTAISSAADQTAGATSLVTSLARMPAVQQAAAAGDLAQIRRIAAPYPSVAVYAAGTTPPAAPATISRSAELRRDGRPVARIVATVPLASLPRSGRRLVAVSGGRIVAGDVAVGAPFPEAPGGTATVEVRGHGYRVAASGSPQRGVSYRLVAVAPTGAVDAAVDRARRRTAFAALALAATCLAVLLGWPLLRRRPPGRPRLARMPDRRGNAALLVGSALGSTHDLAGLLQVVVQTAVETTGAAGARLVEGDRELARAGDPAALAPVEFPLAAPGGGELSLLVYPAGRSLSPEAQEAARTLATQAAIALENARLHLTVLEEASTDEVTGLRNRRRFRDALDAEIGRSERFGGGFALVVADIDDFKRVNDGFGHAAGDLVLRAFADVVRTHVRDVDLAARVGGDEFAVLLPQTDAPSAAVAAERLCRSFAELDVPLPAGDPIRVTASFGVAAARPGEQAAEVFRRADGALYEAKRRGKSQVAVANGDPIAGAV